MITRRSFQSVKVGRSNPATIITWDQTDIKESIALSFLDPWECRDYWKVICAVLKLPFVDDLYDIEAGNMKCINKKLVEDPDLKSAYLSLLTMRVA